MSLLDARRNFAIAPVQGGYAVGATEVTLASGYGARFPDPATDGAYNVVWWNYTDFPSPADDAGVEVVRVTAKSGDVLTVTRAQEGTSASAKDVSAKTYRVALDLTAKMIGDIESLFGGDEAQIAVFDAQGALQGDANLIFDAALRSLVEGNGNASLSADTVILGGSGNIIDASESSYGQENQWSRLISVGLSHFNGYHSAGDLSADYEVGSIVELYDFSDGTPDFSATILTLVYSPIGIPSGTKITLSTQNGTSGATCKIRQINSSDNSNSIIIGSLDSSLYGSAFGKSAILGYGTVVSSASKSLAINLTDSVITIARSVQNRFDLYAGSVKITTDNFAIDGKILVGTNNSVTGTESLALGDRQTVSGNNSFAIGSYYSYVTGGLGGGSTVYNGNVASGLRSMAMGAGSQATGQQSMAIGYSYFFGGGLGGYTLNYTRATAENAVSIGNYSIASGINSLSIGNGLNYSIQTTNYSDPTKATGLYSVAIGNTVYSTGVSSFALGTFSSYGGGVFKRTQATGDDAFALGVMVSSTATNSIGLGRLIDANGSGSFALGNTLSVAATNSMVLGTGVTLSSGDSLFVLGGYANYMVNTVTNVPSAVFNVFSTNKGFLPPIQTTTQKNAISSPAAGLLVHDTTLAAPSWYDGSAWKRVMATDGDTTGKSAKTDALNSATTVVNVSAATAPTTGQVLTATGASTATWQAPSGGISYPGAGIAVSTGTAWDTSIEDNSSDWNAAYGWGNHASQGYITASALTPYLLLAGGTMTGALLFTDNTYDIGTSSATRPRTGYFATSVFSPLIVGGTGTTQAITYKTTTGVGTTGADHIFLTGNNGSTEALRIKNDMTAVFGSTVKLLAGSATGLDFTPRSAQNITNSIYTDASDNLYISGGMGNGKTINFVRQSLGNVITINSSSITTSLNVICSSTSNYIGIVDNIHGAIRNRALWIDDSANITTSPVYGANALGNYGYFGHTWRTTNAAVVTAERMYLDREGRFGLGVAPTTHKFEIAGGTLASAASAFKVAGTLSSTAAEQWGAKLDFVSGTNSGTAQQNGFELNITAGYTGSSRTRALGGLNTVAGTGNSLAMTGTGNPVGNIGAQFSATATTTGLNMGMSGVAENADIGIGLFGKANYNKNSATNIGVLGNAYNTGTSAVMIGGFFGLNNSTPSWASAALIADNGGIAADIFVARENGAAVFTIADGGATTLTQALVALTVKASSSGGFISSDGSTGVSGTWTTVDLKTITAKDGIITSIV